MRQLERACRQLEASGCGSAFQAQGADGRNTGRGLHQERLPFQRFQSGQAFQLFQDWRGIAAQQTRGIHGTGINGKRQ